MSVVLEGIAEVRVLLEGIDVRVDAESPPVGTFLQIKEQTICRSMKMNEILILIQDSNGH